MFIATSVSNTALLVYYGYWGIQLIIASSLIIYNTNAFFNLIINLVRFTMFRLINIRLLKIPERAIAFVAETIFEIINQSLLSKLFWNCSIVISQVNGEFNLMKKGFKNLLNCLFPHIKVMSLIKDFESLRNLICIFCKFYPIS